MTEQQSLRVLCLQTRLTQYHYQSYPILKHHLLKRIHLALNPSNEERACSPTLIVLPECTGTWLYLMCVPMPQFLRNYFFNYRDVRTNRHLLFIAYTLLTHLPSFCKELYRNYRRTSTCFGWIQRSWFTLFSRRTHAIYQQLFRELACESNCTIVAGSTFISDEEQHLYSLSCVFEPVHGSVCLQSGKRYPADEEHSFLDCYHESPRIYSIPNTNVDIGVLICADSWMPEMYEAYHRLALQRRRRFLFIIVALNVGRWDIPWPGYGTHFGLPADVNQKHLQTYSLGKAWFRYAVNRAFEALSRRQELIGYGVVCCQGILNVMNDVGAEGESLLLIKRSDTEAKVLYEAKTFQDERVLSCEF